MKFLALKDQIDAADNNNNHSVPPTNTSVAAPYSAFSTSNSMGITSDQSQSTVNFHLHGDEFKCELLEDSLYELQDMNARLLKKLFVEYQINAFGKAWGNDKDYIRLSEKLRDMLIIDGKIYTQLF